MRKPIIAGNWKMNKVMKEAVTFAQEVKSSIPSKDQADAVICAPALFLDQLVKTAEGSDLKIGAQNMHFEESGAYTGEISPAALQDIGVSYVIIGHSERREMFNETDEDVNKKVLSSFQYGMIPIVCVGETLQQRENDETFDHVGSQVVKAMEGLTSDQAKQLVIAYEPIWAIGTGKSSDATQANEVCAHIRATVAEQFSENVAAAIRIQYGGSVNANNLKEYISEPNIDGALVGGASLDVQSFLQLMEAVIDG